MQRNALKQELVAAGLDPAEVETKGPAWESAIDKRYRSLGIAQPAEGEPSSREKYLALAETMTVSDAALLDLAEQRAVAVKTFLVNDLGMEPSREVIAQASLEEDESAFSGVMLGVE